MRPYIKRALSEQQIQFVLDNIETKTNKELAKDIGVSVETIRRIYRTNGIKKRQDRYFVKGHHTWNKGMKGLRLSPNTEFKKGHLPHNTKSGDGVITIRKHKNSNISYKYIRVSLGKWKPLSHYILEQNYGEIPKSHIVVFKDGDTMNCELDNLLLISRKENISRNANREKATETIKKRYAEGSLQPSDKQVALFIAFGNSNKLTMQEILESPYFQNIVEAKRQSIILKRMIKYHK